MGARVRLHTSAWYGQFAVDFTLTKLYQTCVPLAERLAAAKRSCLLAYDTRFMSQLFARELRRLLLSKGVVAPIAAAPATLPTVQHALMRGQADCALCVSASNLPYWFNGLILVSRNQDDYLPDDAGEILLPRLDVFPVPVEENDPGLLDLRASYLDLLRSQVEVDTIRRATMTIFVDAMNGSAAGYLPAIIGEGQTKAIEINREPDPLFGKLPPHPTENGLARLRKLVRESDSHVGVAISADGTALGVVDNTGTLVNGDVLLALLASYLQNQHRLRGMVVAPEDSRPLLSTYEQRLGLRMEYASDPDAVVAATLQNERLSLLIGRNASGTFYAGRSAIAADAVQMALLVIEMIARSGGKLRTLIDELDDQAV